MGNSFDCVRTDGAKPGVVTQSLLRNEPFRCELSIKLWRNSWDHCWSVEINNKRYDSVTFESVKQLVAHALSDSKKSLIEQQLKTIN
jgi:hypothetical protein